MMIRIGKDNFIVFSDDLTGANGVSGMMAKFCISAVFNHDKIFSDVDEHFQCITLNTKTRMLDGESAYSILSDLNEIITEKGARIGKRIDSTLRGNMEKEIIPFLERNSAIMTDTIPEYGRYTENGNTITQETSLDIAERFRELEVIPLKIHELRNARMESGKVYVVDSRTYSDLERIAEFTYRNGYIPMDPGPLCSMVASLHIPGGRRNMKIPAISSISYIIGSMEKKTFLQLEHARSRGIRIVHINEFSGEFSRTLILRLNYMEHRHLIDDNFIERISRFDSFVLSGGETANTVFEKSGGIYIESLGDLFPIVGIGKIHGGRLDGKIVVTKGGMIGSENIYISILNLFLSGEDGKDRNYTW
jgi:uncharacterized protein YgbK (DUF1537 family)